MGILIKGMEMPTSCYECRFAFDGMCIANRGRKDVGITNSCPLIEVPPHGRLIDADAFLQTIRPITDEDSQAACTFDTVKRLIVERLTNTPTIIESEE